MRRALIPFLAVLLAMSAFADSVSARPLEAVPFEGRKVSVDGRLREWPAFDVLKRTVRGSARGGDPEARGAVGYDNRNLYVAMKIRDDRLVRTRGFGRAEDHATLILAFPRGRGYRTYTVHLFAGETGKSAGAVKLQGAGKVRGAKIVEAPDKNGYVFEAQIPWSTFPEAARLRAGLRAALRYSDADRRGAVRAVIATSKASAGKGLPPLMLEGEVGLYHALIHKKRLSSKPARVAVGDIAGDGSKEVVALYGPYLTVVGSGYRAGKEFFFQELGVHDADAITRFELRDLTGDGKDEIILQKRLGTKERHREVLEVLSVSSGAEAPYSAFSHEISVVTEDVSIRNDVDIKKKGKTAEIVISQGKNKGVDPETYSEPLPGNIQSALLPWQPVKSRTYRWKDGKFDKADEEEWDPPMKPPTGGVRTESADGEGEGTEPRGPPAPPPPRPPSPDELLDQVYGLYRKDRGVGKSKPRFDFVTDVAADRSTERVLVHSKDIVVFGAGFKAGTTYVYITVGVDDPKDILDVTARDLTGDGKAEVIVRGVLHAEASEELGGDVVTRHAVFVYKVTEGGIQRVFAAETGRSLGDSAILGAIRFIPRGRGIDLELRPGRAIGWNEKTYPFPADRSPYGGLEPLLLPWGDMGPRTYRFDGSAYSMP